jgi:cytochrome b561
MPSIKFCFRIHIGFHWLVSFVIIAQLALPFLVHYSGRGSKNGAAAGIIIGFSFVVIHFYMLLE